jgi:hypothetical protein
MVEENVFEIVDRPKNAPVLPTRTVYKTKTDKDGNVERRKVPFVVKGCCDPEKKDKDKYAPTVNLTTIPIIFALAARMGAIVHQLEVKTAFLNSKLDKPIYVEQPINHTQGDRRLKVLMTGTWPDLAYVFRGYQDI